MSGGDTGHGFESKTKSKTRCDIARDSGYTRADMRIRASAGGVSDTTEECNYLHRLPRPYEVADQGTDVFGREKHGQYRDDMGGVGSMLRVNKTLYVGRINEETSLSFRRASANPKDNQDDTGKTPMSRIVRRHFSEWGEIEHAFVTYKYEANAQFAKEAMMHQSLDHDEILNVRWAAEDPRSDGEERDDSERRQLAQKRIADRENERQELEKDYADLKNDPSIDWEEYARAKRQRLALSDEEARRLDEENRRGWDAYYAEQNNAGTDKPAPPPKSSLLNSEAITSLQRLRTQPAAEPKPSSALDGLAAYASDSD
ncbi:Pre-mRNA-splicing factor [Malassezia caprae]|uniref:Pre-mRNA-splicing factor n=1 Tax=Malassezia caprae TaxID=1381934 RepID=A0AAF0IVY5_9BASI|nr:Pre-mRNA-splicing factor [Malassezia caprae]